MAGVPIGDDQPPNTTVPLPGVGQVTFYETTATSGPDGVKLDTVMIHVIVTEPANPMGLPVGTEFRISVARTGAGRTEGQLPNRIPSMPPWDDPRGHRHV